MGVAQGLLFGAGDVFSGFIAFSFNDPYRVSIHEQHVVGGASIGVVFAHGDTP